MYDVNVQERIAIAREFRPPEIDEATAREAWLEEHLAGALREEQFDLAYQPQVDTATGRMVGLEALLRWTVPGHGPVSPAEFIPIAERSGLVVPIGEWVLQRAISDLAGLRALGHPDTHVAVNVSAIQVREQDVLGIAQRALGAAGLPASAVHVELTETALIDDVGDAARAIAALDRAGIEVWVDDFGTGYASLSILRQFAVRGIKIDRSFVARMCESPDDFSLTSAIIAMAQRLRLGVVAEGIEDEMQVQVLSQLGCQRLQGYLLGRPTAIEQIAGAW